MMSLPFTPTNSLPAVTVEPHCRIAQRRDGGEHRATQDEETRVFPTDIAVHRVSPTPPLPRPADYEYLERLVADYALTSSSTDNMCPKQIQHDKA